MEKNNFTAKKFIALFIKRNGHFPFLDIVDPQHVDIHQTFLGIQ